MDGPLNFEHFSTELEMNDLVFYAVCTVQFCLPG